LEACAIQLGTKTCKLIILILYTTPSSNFNKFLRELYATLKHIHIPKTEFLICGEKYRLPQGKQLERKKTHY
jgi:hypothetical protein